MIYGIIVIVHYKQVLGLRVLLFFVFGRVDDASLSQGFAPFHAGATTTTMLLTTFIARPGLAVVDAQPPTPFGYLPLGHVAIG